MNTLLSKELLVLALLTFFIVFMLKWLILPQLNETQAMFREFRTMRVQEQIQESESLPLLEARLKRAKMIQKRLSYREVDYNPGDFSKLLEDLIEKTGVQLWSLTQEEPQLWRLQVRGLSKELTLFLYHFEASPYCQLVEQCEMDITPEMNMNLTFRTRYDIQEETLK